MGPNVAQSRKKWKPLKKKEKKKHIKPLNRQHKLHIKFDAADRKDYLKGFQKRKQERREKAQQKIEEDLKNEMKKIRSERREMMRKMIYEGYEDMFDEEEVEENKNVTITKCGMARVEISEMDLTLTAHPDSKKLQEESYEKQKGNTNSSGDDIPIYTKEKLEELGIFNKKDLQRSWKQSAARTLKANKLMQRRETRHARDQRKGQRKTFNKKKKMKKSKSRGKK
ncbi:hypothetical protein SK128_001239 [Halocaridina rubra]|uniref:Nucleolar protein 12 n=1 Tax=Halocaridina rubra TaxID=373956 RepID=A0AAN9AGN0_HALRR